MKSTSNVKSAATARVDWRPSAMNGYVVAKDFTRGPQKTVTVFEKEFDEYALIRIDGTMDEHGVPQKHTHKLLPQTHRNIADAMRAAEAELGPGGRWSFASQLLYHTTRTKDRTPLRITAGVTTNALAGNAVLHVLASPAAGSAVLDNHAHVFRLFGTPWEAMAGLEAAIDSAIAQAKCDCGPVPAKKRPAKHAAA